MEYSYKIGGYSCINWYSFMWYHTHWMCPPLVTGKHRSNNLARIRLSAAYQAWPSWQLDGRPEFPFLWSQIFPLSMKFLCHFKMDLLVGGSTLNLRLKASCTVTTLFVLWNSSTHRPRCCEVSAILHFTALWRRAGKLKISWVDLSAVNVSAVNVPAVNVSTVNVSAVNVPEVNVSAVNISAVNVSAVNASAVNVPAVNVSAVNVSAVNVPEVNVSAVNISAVNVSAVAYLKKIFL
jgi:hypothetical protein